MKIMVTGATGFVGRHVVNELLDRGHCVIAVARNAKQAQEMSWYNRVQFIQCDLYQNFQNLFEIKDLPDVLIHLAWAGLPNYKDFFHISENLPADLAFLETAVHVGIPHLMVAGTCLEYGMQYGPLSENMETKPTTSYGLAKDTLRKSLQLLQAHIPFTLQWMRLFYIYGEGQNKNSLLAQLDQAIEEGRPVFNMSEGSQLRDYLSVQCVAKRFCRVLDNPEYFHGVINCSSGMPISVVDLVQNRCFERASNIRLNRGFYPYPDYEPFAFWGESSLISFT
jgi:nucleoside-diphosphate-sugar epimerase